MSSTTTPPPRPALESALAALAQEPPPRLTEGVLLATGLVDGAGLYDSPLGDVVVSFRPDGVVAVDLADDDVEARHRARFGRRLVEARPPHGWDDLIRRAIDAGTPGELPLAWATVTVFQRRVLTEAATIPRGRTRPYGWLAERLGRPGAARAVGTSMARNPVPLIVPCHRVVRADGSIGRYSLGGAANKERLLRLEGALA